MAEPQPEQVEERSAPESGRVRRSRSLPPVQRLSSVADIGGARPAIVALTALALGGALFFGWHYASRTADSRARAERDVREHLLTAFAALETRRRACEEAARDLATALASGAIDVGNVEGWLRERVAREHLEHVFQFGVGYAPGVFRDPQGEAQPRALAYVRRDAADQEVSFELPDLRELPRDPANDYHVKGWDDRNFAWYTQARGDREHAGGGSWRRLYFDPFTQAWLIEYSLPFQRGGRFAGAVYINYSVESFRHQLGVLSGRGFELTGNDYLQLLTADGEYLYHPAIMRRSERTVAQLDPTLERLREAPQAATTTGTTATYQPDPHNGRERGLIAGLFGLGRPLESVAVRRLTDAPGWTYVLSRPARYDATTHRSFFFLVLLAVIGLSGLAVLAVGYWGAFTLERMVPAAAIATLLCSLGVLLLWWGHQRQITDSTVLGSAHARAGTPTGAVRHWRHLDQLDEWRHRDTTWQGTRYRPVAIGLHIDGLRFTDESSVRVRGRVWQRAVVEPSGPLAVAPAEPRRVFSFPEAEEVKFELDGTYADTDPRRAVGWKFSAKLRQPFRFKQYPFDAKDVWLRLWPEPFAGYDADGELEQVVLVPDLDGYDHMQPSLAPGVDTQLVTPGWDLERAYFDYVRTELSSNFGLDSAVVRDFPELRYHIIVSRKVVSSFIKTFTPVLVSAFILFAVLLLFTKKSSEASRYGFDTATVMGTCAGLFFTVLVTHIQLRDEFPVDELMYMELFIVAMQLMILLVAVNAILFTRDREVFLVDHRQNLIPKLTYWPVLAFALLVATFWAFLPESHAGANITELPSAAHGAPHDAAGRAP